VADDRRPAGDPGPGPEGDRAPATGSPAPEDTGLAPEEEPNVTGALFLSMVMLMLIAGAWIVMFQQLLGR
jgi:hypothetical protein